ncbi:acyltransferase [Caldanaerobacter subterraneus]|uniref:Chloramphenicol acetyltransferase n=1 Tax=Caldanaerobacter subterraneus TaxID=911092 RepID=A0A7Y2L972_9THEO|nr:acyltransferase [Caldanaerobacter subterraneus]NNG67955.1 acyltransferase [Caldanaerobacter subterraneus]
MKTSFYTPEELKEIGFKKIGKNVLISRKASIYTPEKMEIGDNVRIDDFCILSGKIKLGSFIHIAAGCYLFAGDFGIIMDDFSTLSSRVAIYALTDDFSGNYLTNPTLPGKYRNVIGGEVYIGRHVIVGTGTTILPGVRIEEGVAIGAMSLVKKNVEAWKIAVGIPAKEVKERSRNLIEFEKQLIESEEYKI